MSGTAVGWGLDETNKLSSVLKSSTMPVKTTYECLESNDGFFRSVLDSSLICAGYENGTTVCNGDSGGGLHFERNGVWYVGGIVSFTMPKNTINTCSLKSYAGFTNVYSLLPWIRNVTGILESYEKVDTTTATSIKTMTTTTSATPTSDDNQYEQNINLLPKDCGRQLINRIFDGINAQMYEFPWLARFEVPDRTTGHHTLGCHGALINKRYVLSSASCAAEEPKPHQVQLGDYDTRHDPDCNCANHCECAPSIQVFGIESIIAHPQFDPESFRNDIAMVRLDQDVIFDDHIHPICLPVTPALKQLKHHHYVVAGWGIWQTFGHYPAILQKATIDVLDRSTCRAHFSRNHAKFYVGPGVVCTGDDSGAAPNTCHLDQGAPLGHVAQSGHGIRFVQYGIASTHGCDEQPSINTFVPNYVDWIVANLKA